MNSASGLPRQPDCTPFSGRCCTPDGCTSGTTPSVPAGSRPCILQRVNRPDPFYCRCILKTCPGIICYSLPEDNSNFEITYWISNINYWRFTLEISYSILLKFNDLWFVKCKQAWLNPYLVQMAVLKSLSGSVLSKNVWLFIFTELRSNYLTFEP